MAPDRQIKQPLFTTPRRGVFLYVLSGVVLGATAAYFLDPRQSARRRAVARDRAVSAVKRSLIQSGKLLRHFRNKFGGAIYSLANQVSSAGSVSDRRLESRLRSILGRTIEHPHQVDLVVHEGHVSLRGSLKPHEAGLVVQAIERIPGVRVVDNQIIDSSIATH
jgi:osmotically-inducible protein OsmY